MKYISEGVDGVFCPLVRICQNTVSAILNGGPQRGSCGSDSMLLTKREGFVWPNCIFIRTEL